MADLPFPEPQSLPPSFNLSRCTPADVAAMADVFLQAFGADRRNTFWWPADRESMRRFLLARLRRKLMIPGVHNFKITDKETGELVAWSRWDVPEPMRQALSKGFTIYDDEVDGGKGGGSEAERKAASLPGAPEGSDPALYELFFGGVKRMQEKWDAESKLGLSVLCTSPKYHRRGAGKAMMQPVLDVADQIGVEAEVESSTLAKNLYASFGFVEIDVVKFEYKKFETEDDIPKLHIMQRRPK